MNYDCFKVYCCSKLNSYNESGFNAFVQRVNDVFGDDIPVYKNIKEIYRLFFSSNGSTSKSLFYLRKKYIICFYEWLADNGYVDNDILNVIKLISLNDILEESTNSLKYFSSIEHLLNYISLVGSFYNCGGKYDLLNVKVICILMWKGFSISEISNLKKEDLYKNSIIANINRDYLEIIRQYLSADYIIVPPSQKKVYLHDEENLIRTKDGRKSTPISISNLLMRFNKLSQEHGKIISACDIRRNGIFYDIFSSGATNKADVLEKILNYNIERRLAYEYFLAYVSWKRYYYPDNRKDGE